MNHWWDFDALRDFESSWSLWHSLFYNWKSYRKQFGRGRAVKLWEKKAHLLTNVPQSNLIAVVKFKFEIIFVCGFFFLQLLCHMPKRNCIFFQYCLSHWVAITTRELIFWENVHRPPCVTCHMSLVTCHMSHVTCYMSHVMCHFFWTIFTRVCCQRG